MLAACAGNSMTGADVDPQDLTYASELHVDFSKMTRTASGLYIQDVMVGSGAEARTGNTVRVTYSGWLHDGTLFDSSTDPANPLVFLLGGGIVIPAWDEGLVGMRVGGLRKLIVPPSLGYGNRSVGPIPANAVLVFDVALVRIQP
ncbi:MAG: FKBP-type peptidyl-prolyl cis-trans isomerase [Gemmatimonadota bacterium]|jgi:FKBP-type peptidyl-prolyl cis-trans isomerase